jgi:fungal nitric oxide reductase
MVESLFTVGHVKTLQPYIQKTVDDLLDKMIAKGHSEGPVDLVQNFSLPVPSYVSNVSFPHSS